MAIRQIPYILVYVGTYVKNIKNERNSENYISNMKDYLLFDIDNNCFRSVDTNEKIDVVDLGSLIRGEDIESGYIGISPIDDINDRKLFYSNIELIEKSRYNRRNNYSLLSTDKVSLINELENHNIDVPSSIKESVGIVLPKQLVR